MGGIELTPPVFFAFCIHFIVKEFSSSFHTVSLLGVKVAVNMLCVPGDGGDLYELVEAADHVEIFTLWVWEEATVKDF